MKIVPNWFVMPKMLEDLDDDVFFNDDTDLNNDDPDNVTLFNNNSNNVTFFNDVRGLVNISLNFTLDDDDDHYDSIYYPF